MISPGEQGKTEEQQATPVGVPPPDGTPAYGRPIWFSHPSTCHVF